MPRASAAAAALRFGLSLLFHEGFTPPSWVDLSSVDLSTFGLPKDVDLSTPLLWTTQTDALWQELKVEPTGNTFRGQILAGPSGIGKSHIALLLALRCFAARMPVLYVSDAGVYLASTQVENIRIDMALLLSFATLNADLAPSAASYRISYATPLMLLLNNYKAVVILDEHGHAYNKLMKQEEDPSIVFPLLLPVMYNDYRCIRCVFAGSNQAKFEGELNGTYRPSLRFVVPFTELDASHFIECLGAPPPFVIEDYTRWTNLVPREMVRLTIEADPVKYVRKRRNEMKVNLHRMADALNPSGTVYKSMVDTLNILFHTSSMAMGVEPYSFLDLGYVYRRGGPSEMQVASPLCYPATLALLDLWGFISPVSGSRLENVSRDGAAFENFIWDVLLARGFSEGGLLLPCSHLGQEGTTEVLELRLNEYFVSTLHFPKQEALNAELAAIRERCRQLNISLLYRCPMGCADVDFFVLRADEKVFAIQTSISSLLEHSSVDTIANVPLRFGVTVDRYVFVTVTPENGKVRHKTTLETLPNVRVLSAKELIGV